jgi:hypothetical protein
MSVQSLVAGCAVAVALSVVPVSVRGAPILPDFGAATFVPGASINNPYFPVLDRRTRVFEGQRTEGGETITERFELTNLGAGPTILGVQTQVQRDLAFEDGVLQEKTFDYYAQDSAGNVWYMGEDVTNYLYDPGGHLIGSNSASAWRGGVNGAQPGFIMPANPSVGFEHYQEFSPADGALDQARIFAAGLTLALPGGTFTNVLQVLETTAAEPGDRAFKYYAPGVGLVLEEEGLDESFRNPTLALPLVRVVHEPATIVLTIPALAGLLLVAVRTSRSS